MTTLAGEKWIAAGTLLATNPSAIVRCPERDDGILIVHDKLSPDGGRVVERFIVCDRCGAYNTIRMAPGGSAGM
jgi:hypothetical protein